MFVYLTVWSKIIASAFLHLASALLNRAFSMAFLPYGGQVFRTVRDGDNPDGAPKRSGTRGSDSIGPRLDSTPHWTIAAECIHLLICFSECTPPTGLHSQLNQTARIELRHWKCDLDGKHEWVEMTGCASRHHLIHLLQWLIVMHCAKIAAKSGGRPGCMPTHRPATPTTPWNTPRLPKTWPRVTEF